jgi:signal peptidase II
MPLSDRQEPLPAADPALRPRAGRLILVTSLLVTCLACDRVTKAVAAAELPEGRRISLLGDLVRLERARNPGSFLGLGSELPRSARTVIFTWGVGALALGALAAALHRRASTRAAAGAALVAAGGLGNLWDRVTSGGLVTDFLNLGVGPLRTGVFNVADVAVMVGVALLALLPARRAGERH